MSVIMSTEKTSSPLQRTRKVTNPHILKYQNFGTLVTTIYQGRKVMSPDQGSPVVSTIFTFVDREASMKAQVKLKLIVYFQFVIQLLSGWKSDRSGPCPVVRPCPVHAGERPQAEVGGKVE